MFNFLGVLITSTYCGSNTQDLLSLLNTTKTKNVIEFKRVDVSAIIKYSTVKVLRSIFELLLFNLLSRGYQHYYFDHYRLLHDPNRHSYIFTISNITIVNVTIFLTINITITTIVVIIIIDICIVGILQPSQPQPPGGGPSGEQGALQQHLQYPPGPRWRPDREPAVHGQQRAVPGHQEQQQPQLQPDPSAPQLPVPLPGKLRRAASPADGLERGQLPGQHRQHGQAVQPAETYTGAAAHAGGQREEEEAPQKRRAATPKQAGSAKIQVSA